MPQVSVLMSVYNGERYLKDAIESILNQTFTDFEFIIINDASTDSSRSIILSYDDVRIVLIDNDVNIGLTKSLNKGLRLAKGEYIARMDADDYAQKEWLNTVFTFINANSDCVAVGTWLQFVDEMNNQIGTLQHCSEFDYILGTMLYTNPMSNNNVIIRKNWLDKINGYDELFKQSQDYDLWIRLVGVGAKLYNIPEYLVNCRIHTSSVSIQHKPKQEQFAQLAIERGFKLILNKKVSLKSISIMRSVNHLNNKDLSIYESVLLILFLKKLNIGLRERFSNYKGTIKISRNITNKIIEKIFVNKYIIGITKKYIFDELLKLDNLKKSIRLFNSKK